MKRSDKDRTKKIAADFFAQKMKYNRNGVKLSRNGLEGPFIKYVAILYGQHVFMAYVKIRYLTDIAKCLSK